MGEYRGVELDDLELDGERLRLRRWRAADADRVHAVMQDPAMHEYLVLPKPYTPEDAARFVAEPGQEGRGEGTGLGCAAVERATGQVVGSCALRLAGDPEIGYWVAPDARGHGYAAEMTRILARWAFGIGLRRVRLACDVRNLASVRTALAAGFRFEGVAREGLIGGGNGLGPARYADLARFARTVDDPDERIPYAFPPLADGDLDDEVLGLRALRPSDAAGVVETEDAVSIGWGFTGAGRDGREASRLTATAGLDWLVGGVARFALVDRGTGAFAGTLDVRKSGPPQVGGIGYGVHPAFRGRGYTARALRLLVPWAFDVADYARLELGAKVGNVASIRSAAAAGFEPDGVRRARLRNPDGTFSDEQRFALVNPRYA